MSFIMHSKSHQGSVSARDFHSNKRGTAHLIQASIPPSVFFVSAGVTDLIIQTGKKYARKRLTLSSIDHLLEQSEPVASQRYKTFFILNCPATIFLSIC